MYSNVHQFDAKGTPFASEFMTTKTGIISMVAGGDLIFASILDQGNGLIIYYEMLYDHCWCCKSLGNAWN